MKTVIFTIIILFLLFQIIKYYFKIQFINLQKLKEKNIQQETKNTELKTKIWEAETIDFEEVNETKSKKNQ